MIIKILVIISIVILGSLIFAPQIIGLFSNVSSSVEEIKEETNDLRVKTTESVEHGIDSSVTIIDETSDKINNQINIVKESSKNISEKISEINPLNNDLDKPTDDLVIPTNKTDMDSSKPDIKFDYSSSPIYENLSLSMIQQSNGDVLLQYFDITGNTKSANIVIRTDEKEIFSGIFFTSNFKTVVNDIAKSYYVDVIIEHKDYGTVKSSIFNSGNSIDSKIDGEFIQS